MTAALLTWALLSADLRTPPVMVGVVLDDPSRRTRLSATHGIEALGGRIVHAFEDLLVAEVPRGTEFSIYRVEGVREVALNALPRRRGPRSPGLSAWNAIATIGRLAENTFGAEPLIRDALIPPAVAPEGGTASVRAATGGTNLNTSEYLAGDISVTIVLPESDGTSDTSTENWTADREAAVVAEIAEGLEWVRLREPQAALAFRYTVIAGRTDVRARTRYEPIRRAADPGGTTGEDLWVKEVLGKLGHTTGDRFARSRALAAARRAADGSDWGLNVFVVDSLNDADGKFADGRFAYTWIGGPHVVMTFDNQAWGIDRLDMVFRHELFHAFYAFDEYAGSGCTCTEHRGYLDGLGANCTSCNASASPCVMINNGDAMCTSTRRQIGWADLDGDGVLDVVGEDPDTFLDAMASTWCSPPAVSGLAAVVAPTNRNPSTVTPRASISINEIVGVDVRADGGAWVPAEVSGPLPAAQRRFSASVRDLAPGPHRLEARAVDDRGNLDATPSAADVVVAAAARPLGDSIRGERTGTGLPRFTWTSVQGAVGYRVLRAGSPQGTWSAAGETAEAAWIDAAASDGYFVVRGIDACGVEGSDGP
ncbi:MAG TPA: hypothetical protein VJ826_05430 [Candidatus Polarisedimenticolaceae bacterium]|nr:hypothetical protein [Candidatus Polarisedimenticolaceae bacterium]